MFPIASSVVAKHVRLRFVRDGSAMICDNGTRLASPGCTARVPSIWI
jgi:hypothetical protein